MFTFEPDHVYAGKVLCYNPHRAATGREHTVWGVEFLPLLWERPVWKLLPVGPGQTGRFNDSSEARDAATEAMGEGTRYAAVLVVTAVGIDPFELHFRAAADPHSATVGMFLVSAPLVSPVTPLVAPAAGQLAQKVRELY